MTKAISTYRQWYIAKIDQNHLKNQQLLRLNMSYNCKVFIGHPLNVHLIWILGDVPYIQPVLRIVKSMQEL